MKFARLVSVIGALAILVGCSTQEIRLAHSVPLMLVQAPYPEAMAERTMQAHPDLYAKNAEGLTTLKIVDGALSLKTVNAAPFGYGVEPDLGVFPTVKEWVAGGGMQALG
jgi:hypothetical protein